VAGEQIMKKKILVIDDNPMILFSVKEGLEEKYDSYTVESALGGKECFDLLDDGRIPDLILLDIMMPKMNGWDVYAKLQENETWKKIPIVFLTAKTDDYSKGFGKLVSEDYIEKPFDLEKLEKRINEVFEKKGE
jgi:DNA-binding response OmpR family regulator